LISNGPRLFNGFGVELEYMIVDRDSLSIRPLSDRVLYAVSGNHQPEVDTGELNWSNELVLHVIELKTQGPAASLEPLPNIFQRDVRRLNGLLMPLNARLMPTAMHPWMDPLQETHIWPHEQNAVYQTYDRIFGCQGHGWSNIQSMHINLPFLNDDEFERLLAAVRLVLPILPALAASSPVVEGKRTGFMDSRLEYYRHNQKKIPSLVGQVIPEPLYSPEEYRDGLLHRLYRDIAPFDPENLLAEEWLNSRGAIARFDRNTIEIRLIDMQECPLADLTIAAACTGLIRLLVEEKWSNLNTQKHYSSDALTHILLENIRHADSAMIHEQSYLSLFGIPSSVSMASSQVWKHLCRSGLADTVPEPFQEPLQILLRQGTLSKRIVRSLGSSFSHATLVSVYRKLSDCLESGILFE